MAQVVDPDVGDLRLHAHPFPEAFEIDHRLARHIAGSPRGGDRAAFMYSLIITAKMNDIDPQAWLADVLARLPETTLSRLPELLPWNWKRGPIAKAA